MIKRSAILALHIGYWLLYLLLITMFVLTTAHSRGLHSIKQLTWILFFSPLFLGVIFPAILSFYTYYTILFTRFLQKKKFIQLSIFAALFALAAALISLLILVLRAVPQKK